MEKLKYKPTSLQDQEAMLTGPSRYREILAVLGRDESSRNNATQSPSPPCSLVRDGQTSPHRPLLVVSHSTCSPIYPPPPRKQLCIRSCSNTHTHTSLTKPIHQPSPGSRSTDGWDQIPRTSHPGVLGLIPKQEEPGKTGRHCVKVPGSSRVPAPPWVGSRSPDGWDQIPQWTGGWVLHQPPWSFGFDSQTRGSRENRSTPCVKVPGSSRVPHKQLCKRHHHQ
jgi:hypothetical protein